MTQYVHPCNLGLARIRKHGRGWRSLLGEHEVGRHDSVEAAVMALRARCPRERIPSSLLMWRHLPEPGPIGHRKVKRGRPATMAGARALTD